jgi:YesN/AraC family two-component response regulator
MGNHPTALIADDEPLLREDLKSELSRAWPELEIVAQARNGGEAIQLFDEVRPDICFLDVQMPGLSGIDVARHISHRAHIVFVTAYSEYAVQAFEQGVLDYLVKPVEPKRLANTVARLKERLAAAQHPVNTESLLHDLAIQLQHGAASGPLSLIRAQVGQTLRMTLLKEMEDDDSLRNQIEAILVSILHTGDANIDVIAERLALSRQTIFRKLKAEGTTFQELLDELRRQMALDYLRGNKASVHEIAYLVGFSDPASFSRAFKRWTGHSPHAARANPALLDKTRHPRRQP